MLNFIGIGIKEIVSEKSYNTSVYNGMKIEARIVDTATGDDSLTLFSYKKTHTFSTVYVKPSSSNTTITLPFGGYSVTTRFIIMVLPECYIYHVWLY